MKPLLSVRLCSLILVMAFVLAGCTRRQLVPGLVAGGGAVLSSSGAIYRASLDSDGALGDTNGEIATTSVLIFGGISLLLTGIIWSLTSTRCDTNRDCWSGDVCEQRSHTCIDGRAARQRVTHPATPASHDEADAAAPAEEHQDEASPSEDHQDEVTPPEDSGEDETENGDETP